MKQNSFLWLSMMTLAMTISSCEVIGGIFKAGVWVGIIIVVLIIGLILWLVGKGRR
ncbi:MAG: phosphatidate cytidylyltransferase [Flavisolibacter sp.]